MNVVKWKKLARSVCWNSSQCPFVFGGETAPSLWVQGKHSQEGFMACFAGEGWWWGKGQNDILLLFSLSA